MLAGGASSARWGVHLGACVLGPALYLILTTASWRLSRTLALAAAYVGAAAVASTLVSSGIDGVQRWHDVGPLRVHVSGLLMPPLLVFAAGELTRRPLAPHLLLLGAQAVHLLQPDAGQATALACGTLALVAAAPQQPNKALLLCVYAISGALAWFRRDDLPPVAFVEDILALSFVLAPVVRVLALVSLALFVLVVDILGGAFTLASVVAVLALVTSVLFVLAPLLGARSMQFALTAAAALAGYFAVSLVAPRFGEFPVPLLEFGTSPTLGAFL